MKDSKDIEDIHFSCDPVLYELFCSEVETQGKILTDGLLQLEKSPSDIQLLEALMRSAHSIKGAARIIHLTQLVQLSHTIEDYFVGLQQHAFEVVPSKIDQLLKAVDFLISASKIALVDIDHYLNEHRVLIEEIAKQISTQLPEGEGDLKQASISQETPHQPTDFIDQSSSQRHLRMSAQNLNTLMGLAGESLIGSRWLFPFSLELHRLSSLVDHLIISYEKVTQMMQLKDNHLQEEPLIGEILDQMYELKHFLDEKRLDFDSYLHKQAIVSDKLYDQVVSSRMRPFREAVAGIPRMVRDLARELGKQIKLEISGNSTLIDRDILEKLETPLGHLLRNAVDHGIESPASRQLVGKASEGIIKLSAWHRGGGIVVTVSDDGKGVDLNALKQLLVEKKIAAKETLDQLSDHALLEFLFFPNVSTAPLLTDISGRGVGLNSVQEMVKEVGGHAHIFSTQGKGMKIELELPLTLSVMHALIVSIAGELYALPLAKIDHAVVLERQLIVNDNGKLSFEYAEESVHLFSAAQLLGFEYSFIDQDHYDVILLTHFDKRYGLLVDTFIEEKELVLHPLDPRLGKIQEIQAASLTDEGRPLLIVDIDGIIQSIESSVSLSDLNLLEKTGQKHESSSLIKILVVDDSSSVREMIAQHARQWGYNVDVALNGVDAWNAIRTKPFDLIITDLDMPFMTGIELIRTIRNNEAFAKLQILIFSYQEGDEMEKIGLNTGANAYLTKAHFEPQKLREIIDTLIGSSK